MCRVNRLELPGKDPELPRKDPELLRKDPELLEKRSELLGKDLELPGNDPELSGNDHIEDAEDTLGLDMYMASFPGQAGWPGNETST